MKTYQDRYYKVLTYIDSHLSESLSVEHLSDVAHLSKYHFHRQFSALFDLSISFYIKQLRIKRAAYQLVFRQEIKVIDIALVSGYESSEAFSRAFKGSMGQSPSSFRKNPDWISWHEKYNLLNKPRNFQMKYKTKDIKVNVVKLNEIKIAVLEHRGDPRFLKKTISEFIQWRKENGLPPAISRTFNLVYDDPTLTDPKDYRFDLCASVKTKIAKNDYGIVTKAIPAGRYAVVRHKGGDECLESIVKYLYSDWLNQSGEELRNFPLFFERICFFPDVSEANAVTNVYLPLVGGG